MNYCTWERELLAILEALMRWEDKLLGLQFTIITDHQALMFFKEAPTRSQRRIRWWEYLSRFDYKIQYLKGDKNLVADALLCYFASDKPGESHGIEHYVNADSHLDPEGDDLSSLRCREVEELQANMCLIESPTSWLKITLSIEQSRLATLTLRQRRKISLVLNLRTAPYRTSSRTLLTFIWRISSSRTLLRTLSATISLNCAKGSYGHKTAGRNA